MLGRIRQKKDLQENKRAQIKTAAKTNKQASKPRKNPEQKPPEEDAWII